MDDYSVTLPRWSPKWVKSNFYPNMESHHLKIVTDILETGLLFKEDALQLEDNLQIDEIFNNAKKKKKIINVKFTTSERILSAVAVGIFVVVLPMRFSSTYKGNFCRALCWAGAGISVPIINRLMVPQTLPGLLKTLEEYTILIRKCISSVKEQSLHPRSPHGMSVNTMITILIDQHRHICALFQEANSVIEPLFPWLSGSTLFESSFEINFEICNENLMKLHHLYLLLQSHFLKNLAFGHLGKRTHYPKFQKTRNEKIYWIHNTIIPIVSEYFQYNLISLNSVYTAFKEISITRDLAVRTMPKITREPWLYSEVHGNIILCSSELRSALVKANSMDKFLEACWKAKSKFSPAVLEEDLLKLKEDLLKCFATIDTVSVHLKKIQAAEMKLLEQAVQKLQLPSVEEEEVDVPNVKTVSENSVIDVQDQVYYYEQTEDAESESLVKDYTTCPGENEIKNTKIVLDELKIKLVKREDDMREREAIALENTMPEYKGKVPDFPRQIHVTNGTNRESEPKINGDSTSDHVDIEPTTNNDHTKTENNIKPSKDESNSDLSELDSSDDSSDFPNLPELHHLKDIRKNRVTRSKNCPSSSHKLIREEVKAVEDDRTETETDGQERVKYTFGTGMAMASLLQIPKPATSSLNSEEVFAGSGEVSEDSGNET